MTAIVIPFPRRTAPAADATSAPTFPAPEVESGGRFTPYRNRRTGDLEFLTEFGRAYRLMGRWYRQQPNQPSRLITASDTIAALDAAERAVS